MRMPRKDVGILRCGSCGFVLHMVMVDRSNHETTYCCDMSSCGQRNICITVAQDEVTNARISDEQKKVGTAN